MPLKVCWHQHCVIKQQYNWTMFPIKKQWFVFTHQDLIVTDWAVYFYRSQLVEKLSFCQRCDMLLWLVTLKRMYDAIDPSVFLLSWILMLFKSRQFYLYSPKNHNYPQEALQSADHTTPSVLRPSNRIRKNSPKKTSNRGEKMKKGQEEQQRRDPSPSTDRHAIDNLLSMWFRCHLNNRLTHYIPGLCCVICSRGHIFPEATKPNFIFRSVQV